MIKMREPVEGIYLSFLSCLGGRSVLSVSCRVSYPGVLSALSSASAYPVYALEVPDRLSEMESKELRHGGIPCMTL